MSTIELQQQLISKIQITHDDDILSGLLKMLEFELNNSEVYILNESQKEAIAISKNQIINGEVFTEEQADKLTEEWLKA